VLRTVGRGYAGGQESNEKGPITTLKGFLKEMKTKLSCEKKQVSSLMGSEWKGVSIQRATCTKAKK
jgi:hypothetical protein